MSNDARGWIMCITSGVACLLGATIICVDALIRNIPSQKDFKIQKSSGFLAASLSLSFGVMIFSALGNMLPASKQYLIKGGFSTQAAGWTLLACFTIGMISIQIISSFLHGRIPSHAVNCDHIHEDTAHNHGDRHVRKEPPDVHAVRALEAANGDASETTALLSGNGEVRILELPNGGTVPGNGDGVSHTQPYRAPDVVQRRSSITQVPNRILSFVRGTKANCDEQGPCYGYSDPCGRDCFRHLGTKLSVQRRPDPRAQHQCSNTQPTTDSPIGSHQTSLYRRAAAAFRRGPTDDAIETDEEDLGIHHHHVPENAFLNLGLQTSIAIALHKLPEGFITFATNHANPSLGFSIFTALFIHNITEGFSLALPLFLALHSRTKAILWSFLLGSVSQPLGAAIAMSWFEIAGREGQVPGEGVYGCMFAITAGIMTSVALTLFLEAISLNHNRNLCIAFGFMGMTMMGMSNALKA